MAIADIIKPNVIVTYDHLGEWNGYVIPWWRWDGDGKSIQVYETAALPGHVKGFHRHRKKTDRFFCVSGTAKLGVVDESGNQEVHVLTSHSAKIVVVRPGLWHAIKCISEEPCRIINCCEPGYNAADPDQEEGDIDFDWGDP